MKDETASGLFPPSFLSGARLVRSPALPFPVIFVRCHAKSLAASPADDREDRVQVPQGPEHRSDLRQKIVSCMVAAFFSCVEVTCCVVVPCVSTAGSTSSCLLLVCVWTAEGSTGMHPLGDAFVDDNMSSARGGKKPCTQCTACVYTTTAAEAVQLLFLVLVL